MAVYKINTRFVGVKLYYCKTCAWATSGYCPVTTRYGCVGIDGYCKGPIERMGEIISQNMKVDLNQY